MEFKIIETEGKILELIKKNEKDIKNIDNILVFGVFEGEEKTFLNNSSFEKLDLIYERIKKIDFRAKKDKKLLIEYPSYILIAGLGKRNNFNSDIIRILVSTACKTAKSNALEKIAIVVPDNLFKKNDLFYAGASTVEGAELWMYEFKKYKSKGKNKKDNDNDNNDTVIKTIKVFFKDLKLNKSDIKDIEEGFAFGEITSSATNFARDLVNEPGNVINPEYLANVAKEISKDNNLKCKIFDENKILELGMNAFYGVARGSKNPPRFIHLQYDNNNDKKNKDNKNGKKDKIKKIALLGKGITFDSGGLSLKPADYMTTMKSDKSGACSVLAVMKFINKISPDAEVHCIVAACENMPGGGAQRPDDVVKALNGKTIEIDNTDAEGRLTLADALSYACGLGVDEIIDLATLTGACVVALGEYTSGVMGNNKEIIKNILSTSETAGERMWELPFDDNMKEKLQSPIADLKNVGNRYGGAITAGMFLEEFVSDNTKWCHIDIAGPSFTKTGFAYNAKGATGVGVRTLLYYLNQRRK
ncbi:MAG: leucyl aminopeptidase [bacterium]